MIKMLKRKFVSDFDRKQSHSADYQRTQDMRDAEIKGWNDCVDNIIRSNPGVKFEVRSVG